MPRYDDRLDNVLELLSSSEHSNSDTVFRHISDILIQENTTLEGTHRAAVLSHLATIYPKTSQPARMEVMDIAARVNNTVPELVSIAAADRSIIGTRIWDRVRLSSNNWQDILPTLPKSVLGRLRARLDLPDDIVVSIDREWRDRVKYGEQQVPTLAETLADLQTDLTTETQPIALETDSLIPESEETLFADVEQQIDDEADPLDLSEPVVDAKLKENDEGESEDPKGASDDAALAKDDSEQSIIERSETRLNQQSEAAQTPDETADKSDGNGKDGLFSTTQPDELDASEKRTLPSESSALIDLTDLLKNADARFKDSEAAGQVEAAEDSRQSASDEDSNEEEILAEISNAISKGDADSQVDDSADDDEDDDFALNEKPQVEDQKIQDILERLRDFGSRSRAAADVAEDVIAGNEQPEIPAQEPGRTAALFEPAAQDDAPMDENGSTDAETAPREEKRSAFIFLPEQPPERTDEEEEDALPDPIMFDSEAGFQPLTVNGTTWVTDRFGTIAEFYGEQDAAFGMATGALEGQILSSLFDAKSQQKLDQALNARRPFRDKSVISAIDSRTWMLSAVPVFDDDSGVFLGHRGTATGLTLSQPQEGGETQTPAPIGSASTDVAVLDVASLAHELKTPLNAIRGFAEMIETQQLGPASAFARHRSQRISQEADQLHHILTDLLLAKGPQEDGTPDYTALKPELEASFAPFAEHLDVHGLTALGTQTATSLNPVLLRSIAEKMIHNCALWTPAGRNISINVSMDDTANVKVHMTLIGWMGGARRDDLREISAGPRLSYRHPLLQNSFQGRGLEAALGQIAQAGARLFIRGAGRIDAALILVLPIAKAQA